MKTKHISALVTFVVTFALSVTVANLLGSTGNSNAKSIESVIAQDITNGRVRRSVYSSCLTKKIAYVKNYVDASESIKTDALPADFRMAWQRHMHAWRNHSDYLISANVSDASFYEADAKGVDEINRTWWEVLRIARSYGAEIPPDAYR